MQLATLITLTAWLTAPPLLPSQGQTPTSTSVYYLSLDNSGCGGSGGYDQHVYRLDSSGAPTVRWTNTYSSRTQSWTPFFFKTVAADSQSNWYAIGEDTNNNRHPVIVRNGMPISAPFCLNADFS